MQYFAFFALRGTSTKELSGIMAAFKISFPLLDAYKCGGCIKFPFKMRGATQN
jgi:hypothetical protein